MKRIACAIALGLAVPAAPSYAEDVVPNAAPMLSLHVSSASLRIDEHTQKQVLDVQLDAASSAAFARLTGENVGRSLDIRMNGETLLQPVINSPIETGRLTVSFGVNPPPSSDVQAMANRLNAGATIDVGLVPRPDLDG